MLGNGGTAGLAAADDLAMPVDQLLQQLDILVIHVHGTRPLPIDRQGIFLFGAGANFLAFFGSYWKCHKSSSFPSLGRKFGQSKRGTNRIERTRDCTGWLCTRKVTGEETPD